MKALSLVALALIVATPAKHEAVAAGHGKAKPVSFAKMMKEAKEFLPTFENQTEECDLRIKETREGMTISVKKPKEAVVYLDVSSEAKLTVASDGEESADGSFAHTYNVPGEGKLELVHVDDAYDHLYVTKDGHTTSCELDY